MAVATQSRIESLPGEILSDVLSLLPTPFLVSLAPVSRRFYLAVHSLLRLRLLGAAALSNRELILECYHPSAKLSTPYLVCSAVGNAREELTAAGDLNALTTHYTRFLPMLKEEDRRPRRRYPRATQPQVEQEDEPATVEVTLDSCELFTQLCTVTNVVTLGPRKGTFTGHVNVGDGVVRVWRDWLAARVGKEPGKGEEDILWADSRKDVGIRFRVLEKYESAMQQPLLLGRDEEPVVSYTLVYEELLIRTSTLLLKVEDPDNKEEDKSGIIIDPRGATSKPSQVLFWAAYWHMPGLPTPRVEYVFLPPAE